MSTPAAAAQTEVFGIEASARTREWAKQTAGEILDHIEGNHKFCANCYRRLKHVERPPDHFFSLTTQALTERAVDGFQYPTEHVIFDAIGFQEASNATVEFPVADGQIEIAYDGTTFQTWGCECGVVHHTTQRRPVKAHVAKRYARSLSDTINDIREESRNANSQKKLARVEDWKHSRDRLVHAVEHLKSKSEYQGEKPIFKAALAVALQHPDD